jgi:hypothetical protein
MREIDYPYEGPQTIIDVGWGDDGHTVIRNVAKAGYPREGMYKKLLITVITTPGHEYNISKRGI